MSPPVRQWHVLVQIREHADDYGAVLCHDPGVRFEVPSVTAADAEREPRP
jgi:hypothetical protein